MNTKFTLFFLSITSIFVLNSCLDDVSLSTDAFITSFYIMDTDNSTYSNIEFEIGDSTVNGALLITNKTKFPYGALRDSLIPVFTSTMSNSATTKISRTFQDDTTITVYSSYTKLDFSTLPILSVYAEDGTTNNYIVIIKEESTNPTRMNWESKATIPTTLTSELVAYRFNGKTWIIESSINTASSTTTVSLYSSVDGNTWTKESFDAEHFPYGFKQTITPFKDKLYCTGYLELLDDGSTKASNEIWESSDGITWTMTGALPGTNIAFRNALEYKSKLVVFGGGELSGDATPDNLNTVAAHRSVNIYNGSTWSTLDDLPLEMPTQQAAYCVHFNKIFYVGGSKNNIAQAGIWVSGDGESWVQSPIDDMPAIKDAKLIDYDKRLWLVGGNESGMTGSTIKQSLTEGYAWTPIEDVDFEELAITLGSDFITRAGQSTFIDENNQIWIVGGYNISEDANNAEQRTKLTDIWTGKMNKFN